MFGQSLFSALDWGIPKTTNPCACKASNVQLTVPAEVSSPLSIGTLCLILRGACGLLMVDLQPIPQQSMEPAIS